MQIVCNNELPCKLIPNCSQGSEMVRNHLEEQQFTHKKGKGHIWGLQDKWGLFCTSDRNGDTSFNVPGPQ